MMRTITNLRLLKSILQGSINGNNYIYLPRKKIKRGLNRRLILFPREKCANELSDQTQYQTLRLKSV